MLGESVGHSRMIASRSVAVREKGLQVVQTEPWTHVVKTAVSCPLTSTCVAHTDTDACLKEKLQIHKLKKSVY